MKKAIFLVLMSVALLSFEKPQEPKQPQPKQEAKLKLELTDQEVQAAMYLIDNAKADNLLVKEVKALFVKQLQPQYDSLNAIKAAAPKELPAKQ